MELTKDLCAQIDDAVVQRFAVLDTPHIVVESLQREDVEDTVDNLLALDTFASVFTRVTETEEETQTPTTRGEGRRATQEVAAVVLSEVLVVEDSE